MSLAKDYIYLTNLWEEHNKDIVVDNIERLMGYSTAARGHKSNDRTQALVDITNATPNTIKAWLCRSRSGIKIPLIKLCELAEYLNIDVVDLMYKKLAKHRDWDTMELDDRQKTMFKEIEEEKVYTFGKWNIEWLIATIHVMEDYDGLDARGMYEQLNNDCMDYFGVILGVSTGGLINDVAQYVVKFCQQQKGN